MFALTPKKLAFLSLILVAIPVVLMLVMAVLGIDLSNSSLANYVILLLPFGVLGLVIAGFWFVIGKLISR